MTDFITLSCPSCGGTLKITPDIDRFACAHCGKEHIVKRGDGIISLSPVIEAISQMKVGVDKTAAELAIVRLSKELEEEINKVNNTMHQYLLTNPEPTLPVGYLLFLLFGIGALFYGIASLCSTTNVTAQTVITLIICAIIFIFCIWFFIISQRGINQRRLGWQAKYQSFENEITVKQHKLESDLRHVHEIVSS